MRWIGVAAVSSEGVRILDRTLGCLKAEGLCYTLCLSVRPGIGFRWEVMSAFLMHSWVTGGVE